MTNTSADPSARAEATRDSGARPGRLPAWGVLIGLAIGLSVGVLASDGVTTLGGLLGGDFRAFYGAGRVAAEGDWDDLYDFERQREAQEALREAGSDTTLYFAYAPAVALVYAPFSALEFRWSFLLHTLLMLGALALSIRLLQPHIPWLRTHMAEAMAAALLFHPLLRAVLGGQNTALTLLLLAAIWRLVADGRGFAAGLVLGALFYKPQFALPFVGLFLLDRRWRVLAGAGLGFFVGYSVNAYLLGWDWPATWWSQALEFAELDASVNKHGAVSWVGFMQALRGPADPFGLVVGWTLSAAHVAFLAAFWVFLEKRDWAARFAVTSVGILMISPHTMYYDAGLALLALAVLAATARSGASRVWMLLIWASALLQASARGLGFSPLFFTLVAVVLWTGAMFGRRPPRRPRHAVSV